MPKKSVSFEELFAELEATVEKLEAGNLTLDESLTLYERGMELARRCGEQLDRAELRITALAPAAGSRNGLEEFELNEDDADSDKGE
jgi:exodeoxyribonuclease VII small subunit